MFFPRNGMQVVVQRVGVRRVELGELDQHTGGHARPNRDSVRVIQRRVELNRAALRFSFQTEFPQFLLDERFRSSGTGDRELHGNANQ